MTTNQGRQVLDELRQMIELHGADFVDLGTSKGGSLIYGMKRLGLTRGIGVEIDPAKVVAARAADHLVVEADAASLMSDEPIVSTVMAMHFLEHVPDVEIAKSILTSAATLARDLVFVRQPFFDADTYLAANQLALYWSRWSGHPNRMTSQDFAVVLEALVDEGVLTGYVIFGAMPVLTSDDPAVLPLELPLNQQTYDAEQHGPKPSLTFSEPVFREVGVVAYRDHTAPVVEKALALARAETILQARGPAAETQPKPVASEAGPQDALDVAAYPAFKALPKARLALLLHRRWAYLRYLHLREAVLACPDARSVLAVGCGRGVAETALAIEFPDVTFHLTDIESSRTPNYQQAQTMVRDWGIRNVTFGTLDVLDPPDERYDLVTSVEVLEHIEDAAAAAAGMRGLAEKAVFALVPFSDEASNSDPVRRKRVWENNEHFVVGFDHAGLEKLFPNLYTVKGCYWTDAGAQFRKELTTMEDAEVVRRASELHELARTDIRDDVPTLLREAGGIWCLAAP